MFELNATDYSLLAWVQQSAISVHNLSIRFLPGSLIVQCQTLEQAVKLWEQRSILQLSGQELCFQVDGTVYVEASLG